MRLFIVLLVITAMHVVAQNSPVLNYKLVQDNPKLDYKFPFYKYKNPSKVKYWHKNAEVKVHLKTTPFRGYSNKFRDGYGNEVMSDSSTSEATYRGVLSTKNDSVLCINLEEENSQITQYAPDSNSRVIGVTHKLTVTHKKGEPMFPDSLPTPVWTRDTTFRVDATDETMEYYPLYTETKNANYWGDSLRSISLNKIDYVTFDRSGNFTDNTLNVSLISLSCLSALVAAPVVSIDYRHWGFNSSRYFKVMVPSLAFFTCDLTIYLIMNRERKYRVKLGVR